MIYLTLQGRSVDTDQELTSPQRHVLQKLLAWEHLGLSLSDFAARRAKALQQGWDGRGPVQASAAFQAVADDLAARLGARLGQAPGPDWFFCQAWPGRYAGGGLEPGNQEAGRLEVLVRDAADLERGRLWLDLAPGQGPSLAFEKALAALARGAGPLAPGMAALGLRPRA